MVLRAHRNRVAGEGSDTKRAISAAGSGQE